MNELQSKLKKQLTRIMKSNQEGEHAELLYLFSSNINCVLIMNYH